MAKKTNKPKDGKNKGKNKAFNILSTLIIIICGIVFCASAYQLYQIFSEYKAASDEYDKLELLIPHAAETTAPAETKPVDTDETVEETEEETVVPGAIFMDNVDWKALYDTMYAINDDYEAWLYISNTRISYPVVQGTDNDFYLGHTFYKEPVFSACLFIDYRVENGAEGKNVIVYGHNMKDGSMFAGLKKFREAGFRDRHRSFSLYTSTGAYEYQVFATYTTAPGSAAYTPSFAGDEDFMNYINMVKSWSDYNYGVDVSADDSIITLSTCVNNNQDRYIVQAKRIK